MYLGFCQFHVRLSIFLHFPVEVHPNVRLRVDELHLFDCSGHLRNESDRFTPRTSATARVGVLRRRRSRYCFPTARFPAPFAAPYYAKLFAFRPQTPVARSLQRRHLSRKRFIDRSRLSRATYRTSHRPPPYNVSDGVFLLMARTRFSPPPALEFADDLESARSDTSAAAISVEQSEFLCILPVLASRWKMLGSLLKNLSHATRNRFQNNIRRDVEALKIAFYRLRRAGGRDGPASVHRWWRFRRGVRADGRWCRGAAERAFQRVSPSPRRIHCPIWKRRKSRTTGRSWPSSTN